MKYELLLIDATGLHRIRALRDFSDVRAGDLGGYVESLDNLSQEGDCWVYGNARVCGNARVYGNAWVYGDARVYGNAWVHENARVCGNARVYGNARVHGDAWVHGDAQQSKMPESITNTSLYDKLHRERFKI